MEKKKRGGGTNGVNELLIWGNWKRVEKKREEVEQRERWCVPTLGEADGGEGEARASSAWPIYRPARSVPGDEIFSLAALIHHARSWLTSLGHFAIAGACPCAR